eukprot:403339639
MEMQNNFQKFAKIEEKAKQRTAFIVKKMKNFRARFMKQVKYEMTRKNVARLPQEELNDQFVSADEYREILQHDEIQEQLEETIRVSFLDNSQITLKKTVFDKIQQQIKEKQISDLQEYHNSKQLTRQISNASSNRINYTNQNTRIGSASSARESLSNYNHNNSNSRNKVSIPSLLLPQVKETIKQKQRIDKIIDNCRRLQEKEAFKSQAIKKSAKYLDDGMNSDFNKLQKKIQIILSLNNEFNTQQAKNLTARL